MSEPELIIERDGFVALVTLNRPERLNALSAGLLDSLRGAWSELGTDESLRCVILTGAGSGFCSGADMGLLGSDRSAAPTAVEEELAFLPRGHVAVPIIVAVNGVCAGGGLHFLAEADIALCSPNASFLDPHTFGGQVSAIEPLTLMTRMRPDLVRRMVLLGRAGRLSAAEALAAGLVSEVVEAGRLLARARELAEVVAQASPAATRETLRIMRAFEERLIGDQLQAGWDAIRRHWAHPDALEGPQSFAEKRPPVWSSTL